MGRVRVDYAAISNRLLLYSLYITAWLLWSRGQFGVFLLNCKTREPKENSERYLRVFILLVRKLTLVRFVDVCNQRAPRCAVAYIRQARG